MDFTVISQFFRFVFGTKYSITTVAPRYVKVPNRAVDVDSRALLACYPRGNFWLMIFRGSTNHGRFTKFEFPPCASYPSCSQASLCLYTTNTISIRV